MRFVALVTCWVLFRARTGVGVGGWFGVCNWQGYD